MIYQSKTYKLLPESKLYYCRKMRLYMLLNLCSIQVANHVAGHAVSSTVSYYYLYIYLFILYTGACHAALHAANHAD
jgi:hypothetical protein